MALTKVRYKGLSDVRTMSKAELAEVGVAVDGPLRWDARNRHTVHIESMSEALEDVFRKEGNFQVEEVDAETAKTVKTIVKDDPSKADDTGATVVDGSTGQKSVKK